MQLTSSALIWRVSCVISCLTVHHDIMTPPLTRGSVSLAIPARATQVSSDGYHGSRPPLPRHARGGHASAWGGAAEEETGVLAVRRCGHDSLRRRFSLPSAKQISTCSQTRSTLEVSTIRDSGIADLPCPIYPTGPLALHPESDPCVAPVGERHCPGQVSRAGTTS